MTSSEIIESLGGTGRVAELFEISPQAVSQWRIGGIPKARMQTLRLLRPDLFREKELEVAQEAA